MFPKDFLWGASTSSHQVEGNTHNDWSEWEKSEKRKEELLGKNINNFISGVGADHYNRYKEDFDIAKKMGHTSHRFSLEWSRIEPQEGIFDEKELEHYKKVLLALKKRNMIPFPTLWHWTIPLWLSKKGGIESKEFPEKFARFTEKVMEVMGNHATHWITLNEPMVYASNSYLHGKWTPQKKSLWKTYKVAKNLKKAHKKAYQVIKAYNPNIEVGIAKHQIYFENFTGNIVDTFLKKIADKLWNTAFIDGDEDFHDFIGINYYFHCRIKNGNINNNENKKVSDLGWELYATGLAMVVQEAKEKWNKPMYITEHGLADHADKHRAWYLKTCLHNLEKEIENGANVKGYMHWSLLDNFEWAEGFNPRFGLIEIDYKNNSQRKPRASSKIYSEIITKNTAKI